MATDRDKPGAEKPGGDKPGERSTRAGRPGTSSGSQRRPVTIDLQAREVSRSEPVAKPDPAAPKPSAADVRRPDALRSAPGASKPAAASTASSEAVKPDAAKPETAKTGASATEAAKAAGTETRKPETAAAAPTTSDAGKAGAAASTASTTASGAASAADRPTPTAAGAKTAGATAEDKATADKRSGDSSAATAAAAKAPPRAADHDAPRSAGSPLGLVAAAFVGGALVLAGAYGLHRAGYLPIADTAAQADVGAALTAAQSRIASLESHVADLRTAAESSGASQQALDGLAARVAALETSVGAEGSAGSAALERDLADVRDGLAELRSVVSSGGAGENAGLAELSNRVAALRQEVEALKGTSSGNEVADAVATLKAEMSRIAESVDAQTSRLAAAEATLANAAATRSSLQASLAELNSTVSATAANTTEALDALQRSIAAIESRLAPLEESIGTPGARETAARALAVSALTAALDAGRPYAAELSAVAAALPQDTDLTSLRAHADTGLATKADLVARFPAVARAMAARIEVPLGEDNDSLVDRFLTGAQVFIGIRHVGGGDGTTPADVLGRMEARVAAGDLAGALAAYDTLPDPVKAAGAEWAGQARARVEADAVVASVTDEVLRGLSGSGG